MKKDNKDMGEKLEVKLVTPDCGPDSSSVLSCSPDESCGPDTCPVCGPANPECSP